MENYLVEEKRKVQAANVVRAQAEKYGSVRKAASALGMDPGYLSRIKNQKYGNISAKLMTKISEGIDLDDISSEDTAMIDEPLQLVVNCKGLKELEAMLDKVGYELIFRKKGES